MGQYVFFIDNDEMPMHAFHNNEWRQWWTTNDKQEMSSGKQARASWQQTHWIGRNKVAGQRHRNDCQELLLLSVMTTVSWACGDSNSNKQAKATSSAFTSHITTPYKKSKP